MRLRWSWWLAVIFAIATPWRADAAELPRVLVNSGRLVVVPLDGSAQTVLPGTDDAGAAAVSPDGRWVAFTRQGPDTGGNGGSGPFQDEDLFVVAMDGRTSARLMTADTVDNFGNPMWAPDSRTLAFSTSSPFSLRAPAAWYRVGVLDVETGQRRVLTSLGDAAFAHAWSPSGRLLVTTPDPLTVLRDGTDRRALPAHVGPGRWSTDGLHLAWLAHTTHDDCRLLVGDTDARNDRTLVATIPCTAQWRWADANTVVFVDGDVHSVDLHGTRSTLTATAHETDIASSRDGKTIATTSDRDRNPVDGTSRDLFAPYGLRQRQPRVFVMQRSGADQRPVADGHLVALLP